LGAEWWIDFFRRLGQLSFGANKEA
jgi:hypothetical protein